MQRPTKIAILSSSELHLRAEGYSIDCMLWSKLDESMGFNDYDIIILDLNSLHGRGNIRWHMFEKLLNRTTTRDILIGKGRIVIVGNPCFEHQSVSAKKKIPFLSWTGLRFNWAEQRGDTVVAVSEKIPEGIAKYMSYLEKWDHSLRSCDICPDFSKLLLRSLGGTNETLQIQLHCDHFYCNRFGASLAFAAHFVVLRATSPIDTETSKKVITRLGPIFFIPTINLNEELVMEMVLRDICGATTALQQPAWAEQMIVPGQNIIDDEISNVSSEMETVNEKLKDLQASREGKRQCLRLLYDTGTSLEEIVRETLKNLGAAVRPPEKPWQGNGLVRYEVRGRICEGILRIHGTDRTQFDEQELTMLHNLISLGIRKEKKKYRGIFIGNSRIRLKPLEREYPFSRDFREDASLRHFVALTTHDLYECYTHMLSKGLNTDSFWSLIFETDGILDISRLGDFSLQSSHSTHFAEQT